MANMDIWQKLEVLKSSDNWIEVKTLDGKTLRFSKTSSGSSTPVPGDQGYADLESFDVLPGDEPKRKVIVDVGPMQSVPTSGLPLKNVQRTFMDLPADPAATPPKPARIVEGTPNPPPGMGPIKTVEWDAATETLTNKTFWPAPPPE